MTQTATPSPALVPSAATLALRRRRYAADRRLRTYGIMAISFALGLLAILVTTLVTSGYPAFTQTFVRVDFPITEELVDPADPGDGNFRKVMQEGISTLIPGDHAPKELRAIADILTNNTQFLRDREVDPHEGLGEGRIAAHDQRREQGREEAQCEGDPDDSVDPQPAVRGIAPPAQRQGRRRGREGRGRGGSLGHRRGSLAAGIIRIARGIDARCRARSR
jgi:hypothetical protein